MSRGMGDLPQAEIEPGPPEGSDEAVESEDEIDDAFDRLVSEGRTRLARPWSVLITTGLRYLRPAAIQGTLPLIGAVLFLFA